MSQLFSVYPELEARIDRLCGPAPWCITGASALIHDGRSFYFEITKAKHWRRDPDGSLIGGIGGIGGSLAPGEEVLACLHREVEEELGARVQVESSGETHLVYEQSTIETVPLVQRNLPAPVLGTISANLYRRTVHPECEILMILTFLARLRRRPMLGDLLGLLIVPREALPAVFGPDRIAIEALAGIPGVEIITREPLPERIILEPVWTARSLQILLQAGRLAHLGA